MARGIEQQLIADLKHYEKTGEKTPLLFLTSFIKETIYLKWICNIYRKSSSIPISLASNEKAVYYRFYRLLKRLAKEKLIVLQKEGNDLVRATATKAFFDLLKRVQNSNHANAKSKTPFTFPARAREERIEAIKICYEKDMLTISDIQVIKEYFQDYLNATEDLKIVLERVMGENIYGERYIFLDYKTRFNCKAIKKMILHKYEGAIKRSLQMYKSAVHLVLTTDPKLHKSLWHANRHFNIALNKFFSFIQKRLGYRPDYLAVYEFTKSGLLHAHVLIFGISFLIKKDEITKEWERCNQGSYNYIYALQNTNGAWHYKRERPSDCEKGVSADDYLKKYLKKAQYDETLLFMYWVFNKRFFTCSRALTIHVQQVITGNERFIFIGAFNIYEIPAYILEDIPSFLEENNDYG